MIISSRSKEPEITKYRSNAFQDLFDGSDVVILNHWDDEAPQNPSGPNDKEFWDYWKRTVETLTGLDSEVDDINIIASESYGADLAKALNGTFVPYDVSRSINGTKGTDVRSDIAYRWNEIILPMRQRLQSRFVLFGQESVGKTTISEILKNQYYNFFNHRRASFLPEYARPYLEMVGKDLSQEKMDMIFAGQRAMQDVAYMKAEAPVTILDTDLFSTVGYYEIGGFECSDENMFQASTDRCDLYFILPDDVPFVKDPLRYGGDKRESTIDFWVEICEIWDLSYIMVPEGSEDEKAEFIFEHIKKYQHKKFKELKNFKRD